MRISFPIQHDAVRAARTRASQYSHLPYVIVLNHPLSLEPPVSSSTYTPFHIHRRVSSHPLLQEKYAPGSYLKPATPTPSFTEPWFRGRISRATTEQELLQVRATLEQPHLCESKSNSQSKGPYAVAEDSSQTAFLTVNLTLTLKSGFALTRASKKGTVIITICESLRPQHTVKATVILTWTLKSGAALGP